jgi:hypothetical protein
MEELRRFRALERLCRKRAAHYPELKWVWLGQAAKWKIAADLAMSSHFEECNTNRSSDLGKSSVTSNPNDTRWKTIAGAF